MNLRKKRTRPGSRPGSLMPPHEADPTIINLIDFDQEVHEERRILDLKELEPLLETGTTSWIDVQGLADTKTLKAIGELFGLHPLALEDAVNIPVQPKAELYEGYQLVVSRMVRPGEDGRAIIEQVTLFVGPHWLLTIQERHGDVFGPVRKRTQNGPRMRVGGPSYLAYALLDLIVDAGFPVIDSLDEDLDRLEDEVLDKPGENFVGRLNERRREIQRLRRSLRPQREAISALIREESPHMGDGLTNFLRDILDHSQQLSDMLDGHRDQTGNVLDLYMTYQGNQMNQVMQVLTIVGAIFIPLTFMAGIYGMNFEFMPELAWRPGYHVLLATMLVVAAAMGLYFYRRGWLGPTKRDKS